MRTLFYFIFGILFFWSNPLQAQHTAPFNPSSAHYLWPTEASSHLTSTFGETRAAHFHAALDIKTWGRRGYKVFATRDGVVDRIAIGPRGYGKVVYLKHDDGSYSVYAHLLSFNDKLQQYADSVRFAESYAFDIERYISWKNIRIKQGEVIGYSGASGIGPPHLHFELRTPSEKPFNPLLTNLAIQDDIAPQIKGISLEPLSFSSSIEGKNAVLTKRAWYSNGSYRLSSVDVSGPVGLGINVFDQSNGVTNAYAVYELSMAVDGQQLFKSRVDSFSYGETHQMFIDRVYPLLQNFNAGYQRLYIAEGNSLPFYTQTINNGKLDLKPGRHTVTIRATDYFGNQSKASLELNVQRSDIQHPQVVPLSTKKLKTTAYDWHWYRNWVTFSKEDFATVTIAVTDSSRFIQHDNGLALSLSTEYTFMNIPGTGPIRFHRISPQNGGIISAIGDDSYTIFPKNTFYDTVSVGMSINKRSSDSLQVSLLPEAYPVRDNFRFKIQRDSTFADTSKWSFYKFDQLDDRDWELIPTTFSKNYIIGKAESLGVFHMLKDTTAPSMTYPRTRERPDGQWVILIDVTDNLSGIDYSETKIWMNGVRGIAEYEPEDDRFVYYHPDFIPSSKMKIAITAADKMGNMTSTTFYLGDNIETN